MKRFVLAVTLALAMVSTAAIAYAHAVETEIDDAGDTPQTAQVTHGSKVLTTILGTISSRATDADLYAICLTGDEPFSATTAAPGTSIDTQLFLFDADGYGVYGNDDSSGLRSELPAGHPLSPTGPGLYYIGISMFNLEPSSVDGTIFEPTGSPFGAITEPTGPGAGSPLSGWTSLSGSTGSGPYEITLTGTSGAGACGATKASILSGSGVPGKGIADAPGLQKPFNPKSQAAANAGKK